MIESFISAGDAVLRYVRYGKGEKCVLMLHGYGESLEVWEDIGGQLGKEFSVVAVDLPGSGMSTYGDREVISIDYMAQCVAEVLTKVGVESYSIVAHSMGGYVAAALAEVDSDRVEKVVMFHSSPTGDTEQKREIREREMAVIEAGKKEMLAESNPSKGFAPQNVKRCEDAIDEKIEQFMLTDDEALVATLKGMAQREDRTASFSAFCDKKPVLFVFGAFDPYIGVEAREYIEEKFKSARFVMLENSAHMGFKEQPDESLALLLDFLGN